MALCGYFAAVPDIRRTAPALVKQGGLRLLAVSRNRRLRLLAAGTRRTTGEIPTSSVKKAVGVGSASVAVFVGERRSSSAFREQCHHERDGGQGRHRCELEAHSDSHQARVGLRYTAASVGSTAVAGSITIAVARHRAYVSHTRAVRAATPFVAVLGATKLADAATTYAGLELVAGVREANPLVADLVHAYGTLPALAAITVAVVCVIGAVTELAVVAVDRFADAARETQLALRLVGYGLPSVIHVALAARNAAVLAGS